MTIIDNRQGELRVSSLCLDSNKNCWKPCRNLKQDPATTLLRLSKQTTASSRWVSNAVSQLRMNNPNSAGCDGDVCVLRHLWMFGVVIAEKEVLSRGHPCIVRYHGDPVKLGERFAGRADWVAVLLPQKQEAVCVASWPRHQERWLSRESGGACQRKDESESPQPFSACIFNYFCYTNLISTLKRSSVKPAVMFVSIFITFANCLWINLKLQHPFLQIFGLVKAEKAQEKWILITVLFPFYCPNKPWQ